MTTQKKRVDPSHVVPEIPPTPSDHPKKNKKKKGGGVSSTPRAYTSDLAFPALDSARTQNKNKKLLPYRPPAIP